MPKRSRPAFLRARTVSVVLCLAAVGLLGAATPEVAAAGEGATPSTANGSTSVGCPATMNAYTASSADLAACGVSTYPEVSSSPLSDGGTSVTYASPSAPTVAADAVSFLEPPAGFKAATASAAELAQYGIPEAPSPSNATAYSLWQEMVSNMQWSSPPAALHNLPTVPLGVTPKSSSNWSGYATVESSGYFHYTGATYTEPPIDSSSCSGDTAAYWTGIGGVNNNDLGQNGTVVGGLEGYANNEGVFETNLGTVYNADIAATVGSNFYVTTSYSSDTYTYYFYNYANGDAITWTQSGVSAYSGATTDYIVERPTTYLTNFGTMQWPLVTAAAQQYPIDDYPLYEFTMYDSNGNVMAEPSALSGGEAFSVTQHSCQ